jgi:predicted nuclease of predicted toxin-antitoxin system
MSASLRYFTDEHVATAIARGLDKRGVDVLTVAEAGLLGSDDTDLLAFAQDEQRVIVTQDQDFLRIAAREDDHPGIVYVSHGRSIGEMIRLLDLLAQVSDAIEMNGRVEYL